MPTAAIVVTIIRLSDHFTAPRYVTTFPAARTVQTALRHTQCVLWCWYMATGPAVMIGRITQREISLTVQKFPEFRKLGSAVCRKLQTVSGPPLTAEAETRFYSSLCEICGEHSGSGTDLW